MRIETHGGAGHARRPRRSKVYVKTIGDKTRAGGVQGSCAAFDKYADGAERIRRPAGR